MTDQGEYLVGELETLPDTSVRDLGPHDLDAVRTYLNGNLFAFARVVFGYRDLIPSLHGDLAAWIALWGYVEVDRGHGPELVFFDKVTTSDTILADYRRVMTQIPREFFKTSVGTRANALWQLCRHPHLPVAIFNERLDNAKRWLSAIRGVVEGSKVFQDLYRDLLPPGVHYEDTRTMPRAWKWTDQELDFEGRNLGEAEHSLSAHGIEGATTGGHWPKMILDDLISVKHKLSEQEMERAREWLSNHIYLMRPAERSMSYINCTPWTYTDIYRDALRDFGYKVYRRSALELPDGTPDVATGESIFPAKLSTLQLRNMYARDPYSFKCSPAETPITMTDWQLKSIKDVVVGDVVVGMDMTADRRRLTTSKVVDVGSVTAEVFEYGLDDGSFVRCTEDHQWLRHKRGYGPLKPPGSGGFASRLAQVHDLQECPDRDAAMWLSGFFDGEGSVSGGRGGSGGFVALAQSDKYPEINDRVHKTLQTLGLPYNIYRSQRGDWQPANIYYLLDGLNSKAKFLRWCAPAKAHQVYSTMFHGRAIRRWPRVVSVKSLGVQTAHWLQTTTGNYLAWGCVSKNSQMQCIPSVGKESGFDLEWVRRGQIEPDSFGEPHFVIDEASYRPDLAGTYSADRERPPRTVPLHMMTKEVIIDPAPSEENEIRRNPHARTAMLVEGIDPWGRRFLLESWAGREGYTTVLQTLFSLAHRWGARRAHVEEVNFSNVYRHWVRREQDPDGRWPGFGLTISPLKPNRRDKDSRILARQADWQAGLYYVNTSACGQFLVEFSEYPNSETKDLMDAMGYDRDPGVLAKPSSPYEQALAEWESVPRTYPVGERDPFTGYSVTMRSAS